ncbi:MAG: SDR family oxidoreductase [Desulfatirhabdiaceae bacterium]
MEIPTTVKNTNLVEKRRKQIILAAIKLFSRNGFHGTTLKQLAEEAGLSHGNIYDYVGSKEDIFFLIHDFLANSAMEILNRSLEYIQDPVDKLRRMVRGEFNLMDQWADALLLIYQETHILQGEFLGKLLYKERAHLEKFEIVLNECIAQGRLRECNVRVVANMIKSMIDSWTIKRWDLRGHANQLEVEQVILDLVFHGLLLTEGTPKAVQQESGSLRDKTVLVVNAGTVLGKAVCQVLTAKGLRVIACMAPQNGQGEHAPIIDSCPENMVVVSNLQPLHLTCTTIESIEKTYGPIDIYVHDLGVGTVDLDDSDLTNSAGEKLMGNLGCAQALTGYFQTKMGARALGRIIYIAPWAWDRFTDPIRYETVKAGAVALSQSMSTEMATSSVNTNCIIPGYIRSVRPKPLEKAMKTDVVRQIPSGRLGEIQDITDAVLYLIGDASRYLTGQVLHVTGGLR